MRCAAFILGTLLQVASGFDFPTANHALLDGKPEDFYMYVERDFEGVKSQVWEGGQFGFVRGPVRVGGTLAFATVHEGVDIKPLVRDPAGNPLDDIHASADGTVVHVSSEAGGSNYGRYIVIEHRVGGSPFYTLYAHLSTIAVKPGDAVRRGETIARMGYTGAGIDRPRAHLHFEVAMLMSRNFEGWYAAGQATPNKHGLFNGMNLSGTNPAEVLLASAKDPGFDLRRHILALDPAFKITVRNTPGLSLIHDYPWLVPDGEDANPPAWTISFTQTGVPIRAVASTMTAGLPRVEWVRESPLPYHYLTRGLVGGPAGSPHLTAAGLRFAQLLNWPDK